MASNETGCIQATARCVHEAIIAHNSASAVPQSMGFQLCAHPDQQDV